MQREEGEPLSLPSISGLDCPSVSLEEILGQHSGLGFCAQAFMENMFFEKGLEEKKTGGVLLVF